jgi:hypothetical protein
MTRRGNKAKGIFLRGTYFMTLRAMGAHMPPAGAMMPTAQDKLLCKLPKMDGRGEEERRRRRRSCAGNVATPATSGAPMTSTTLSSRNVHAREEKIPELFLLQHRESISSFNIGTTPPMHLSFPISSAPAAMP